MAQYNGYVSVPHNTYDAFRAATLGNGYDVDNQYGNQCWDFCALLYWQYGLTLITIPGGNGTAQDCWLVSRAANSVPPFISVYTKQEIRRGDIVVFGTTYGSGTGHIAFADEDYNGTDSLKCLGQNQGQGSSAPSNIATLNLSGFLGVFRNTLWNGAAGSKRRKFPWAVAWHQWDNFKHN